MAEDNGAHHTVDEGVGEVEEEGSGVMTVLITGGAIAILAPELLPGMAIGVAAMLLPRVLPTLGPAVRPLVKTALRAGYATVVATREMAAEASEQVQDMVAEARAERENGGPPNKGRRTSRAKRQPAHT